MWWAVALQTWSFCVIKTSDMISVVIFWRLLRTSISASEAIKTCGYSVLHMRANNSSCPPGQNQCYWVLTFGPGLKLRRYSLHYSYSLRTHSRSVKITDQLTWLWCVWKCLSTNPPAHLTPNAPDRSDRGPIEARSWPTRGPLRGPLEARYKNTVLLKNIVTRKRN